MTIMDIPINATVRVYSGSIAARVFVCTGTVTAFEGNRLLIKEHRVYKAKASSDVGIQECSTWYNSVEWDCMLTATGEYVLFGKGKAGRRVRA